MAAPTPPQSCTGGEGRANTPGSPQSHDGAAVQRLAQSLLARLDEAKDIRISNSTVDRRHVPIVRGWRKLAKGEYAARPK